MISTNTLWPSPWAGRFRLGPDHKGSACVFRSANGLRVSYHPELGLGGLYHLRSACMSAHTHVCKHACACTWLCGGMCA